MVRWLTIAVATAFPQVLLACPNCKFALESTGASAAEPQAYFVSILFMLGTIMTLFGAVAIVMRWVAKQEEQALVKAGYQHVLHNAVTERQTSAGPSGARR